jgi:thioester reductase-like protein
VRASDDEAARQRVLDTLKKHHINLATDQLSRVSCYAAILHENHLGLSSDVYDRLAGSVDLVIHAAWPVHFGAGLQSFVPHLQGLHNLILLSRRHDRAKLLFCSSTASVLAGTSPLIRETVSDDPRDAKSLGYARSKHCAETICASAWKQNGQGRIGILRLGQLSGDTKYGIWKAEEGWPQLFASADCVGCLPELQEVSELGIMAKQGS